MGFKDKFRNDYFISFRNKNSGAKIAYNIHSGLEKAGYTNYYNPKQHNQEKAGYPRRLYRNVRHCKVFVWILTEDCMIARENKPDYYFAEIIWAHKHKKCIVPVMSQTFKRNRIDNDVLRAQFYNAYDNLLKCNVLTRKDKKVVDDIVKRYCTDTSIWGAHDIPEENPLGEEIVSAIIDRISKTKGVYPLKKRWITIPIIHMAVLLVIIISAVGIKKYIDMHNQTIWDGSTTVEGGWSSFKGDGSKEHPYEITTAKQLAWLSYTSQTDTFLGKYFELDADITLNHYNAYAIGETNKTYTALNDKRDSFVLDQDATHKWTPIGNKDYPFSGSFDGKGHMIYGLLLNESYDYQGLFGLCSLESRIINTNLMCTTIETSNSYVGSIAGKSDGLIDRCSVYRAAVSGKKYIGGIAGEANVISNSFANAVLDSSIEHNSDKNEKYEGGIAGKCCYLINSSASSEFSDVDGQFVGGLVGEITRGAYNCVELDMLVAGFNEKYYLKNDVPITICSVFGSFDGNESQYSNIYYNGDDEIEIQIGKEEYINLTKKYPDFFKGFDGTTFNSSANLPFNYHEYSIISGKYNQVSEKLKFNTITDNLNKGINNVKISSPNIYLVLKEYGGDDGELQLVKWHSNDKGECLPTLGMKKSSPWLKNVIDIRDKWESKYDG